MCYQKHKKNRFAVGRAVLDHLVHAMAECGVNAQPGAPAGRL